MHPSLLSCQGDARAEPALRDGGGDWTSRNQHAAHQIDPQVEPLERASAKQCHVARLGEDNDVRRRCATRVSDIML